jgi:hypothetical protein
MSNQRDETIPVGFRVTKQQRDELQRWASYFANQKRIESIDHNTGKAPSNNISRYDTREIIMKDCIGIWQKATIRDALPDEYKEKLRQKLGKEGNKARYGSGSEQATEFAPFDEKSNISRD